MVVNLDFDTILVWLLVGLVAGFAASHLALGHGLGIVGDVLIGIDELDRVCGPRA